MGLLDYMDPDKARNALKGLLGGMPITKAIHGEGVSVNGLKAALMGMQPFDAKSGAEDAYNAGLNALTFAGVNAKTANKGLLSKAQQLDASGVDRGQIWNETGWFKGPEGKWRFEIDDSGASIPPMARSVYGRSDMVLKHDPLYAAYPEQAGKPMMITDDLKGVRGNFDRSSGLIKASPTDTKSTLLHESQHAVQTHEGFAKGGSPELMALEWSQAKDKMDFDTTVAALVREAETSTNGYVDEAARLLNDLGIEVSRAHIDRAMKLGTQEAVKLADESQNALRKFGDLGRPGSGDAGTQLYRRLAGEAEARATQARMDFPMDKRKQIPPWESYDIPWDQLIVR